MNDLVEGCRITGKVTLDGEDIYKGDGCQRSEKTRGNGLSEAEPVSDERL